MRAFALADQFGLGFWVAPTGDDLNGKRQMVRETYQAIGQVKGNAPFMGKGAWIGFGADRFRDHPHPGGMQPFRPIQ